MTPTILNCGGSVTRCAAAEVVAEAVAEAVLLEVAIGSKQVQAALHGISRSNQYPLCPIFL